MRIYNSLKEAVSETRRELAEMGLVSKRYYQSSGKETETKELIGYGFKIIPEDKLTMDELMTANGVDKDYCLYEFKRRISEVLPNNVMEFCNCDVESKTIDLFKDLGMANNNKNVFSYDYAERLFQKIAIIIHNLKLYPNSRQQVATIYEAGDLIKSEKVRVPCSMYYHFVPVVTKNSKKLSMIYTMRSSDVMHHFPNDLCMAMMIWQWVANKLDYKIDSFTFFSSNLHEYVGNLEGVF